MYFGPVPCALVQFTESWPTYARVYGANLFRLISDCLTILSSIVIDHHHHHHDHHYYHPIVCGMFSPRRLLARHRIIRQDSDHAKCVCALYDDDDDDNNDDHVDDDDDDD